MRFWAIGLTIPLAVLVAAPAARAGTYSVAVCDLGVGPALFSKIGIQAKFKMDNDCTNGGAMRVADDSGTRQFRGAQGGWGVDAEDGAPSWLAPTGAAFSAAGKADGGLRPQIEAKRRGASGWSRLAGDDALPRRGFRRFSVEGPYTRLRAVLRCAAPRCGRDSDAFVRLKRVRWRVFEGGDPAKPALGGTIVRQPAQRGLQSLGAGTRDAQSGVFSATIQVNGTQLTTLPGSCANGGRDASGRISLGKWRPCADRVAGATTNTNDGTVGPFREGLNGIRACASDFAGNSTCGGWSRIRVDNHCPIAPAGDTASSPASLAARFGNGKRRHRVRFPHRPKIHALLRDATGQPLVTSSASMCATQKVALSSRPGTSLVTPAFPSGGSLNLPAGSSRTIWVNYWLDSERVLSAPLKLRTRARLGLRVRPKGRVHNGQRMRVRAKLRGPFHARRKVIFKVRTAGKTFRLGSDRTNHKGIAKVRHRFSQIQGKGSIRVRAVARYQRGFPYLKGHSPRRKVRLAP